MFEKFQRARVKDIEEHEYLINLISCGIKNRLRFVKTDRLIKAENDKLLTSCGFRIFEPNNKYEIISLN